MSYEKAKNISMNEKQNKIILTTASNNVRPLYYSKWEYGNSDETFRDKLINLVLDIFDGNIHLQGQYKLQWAINETYAKLKETYNKYECLSYNNYRHNDIYILEGTGDVEKYNKENSWNKDARKFVLLPLSEYSLHASHYTEITDRFEKHGENVREFEKNYEVYDENKNVKRFRDDVYETFMLYYNLDISGKFVLYSKAHNAYVKPNPSTSYRYGSISDDKIFDFYKASIMAKRINHNRGTNNIILKQYNTEMSNEMVYA